MNLSPRCRPLMSRCSRAILRESTVVHDLEEDPDVNPAGVTMETPGGEVPP